MSKLLAGFARTDISPLESVPLSGYGRSSSRMSNNVSEPLYANALALTDESGSTAIVIGLDMGNMYPPLPSFRSDVAQAVGIPVEQVMFSATHTHSAPHLSNEDEPTIPRYCQLLKEKLVEAAVAAMADRKEATLSVTAIRTQNMNFVRRYVLADGTFAGDNYGHFAESPIARHESEPDRMLQLVKFSRAGSKDIIMANFQGHPHRGGGSKNYNCTSDLVYYFRNELEQQLDCHAVYFTGASGNLNCHSRIPEENITVNHVDHGKALAAYALEALKQLRPVENGAVRMAHTVFVGRCNHTEDHKVEQAKIVVERWKNGATGKECRKGFEDMFNSPYHATSVISKAERPETMDVELHVLSFGDVSMIFAPFELFSDLGVQIKEGSPFDTTFVCCYANKLFSYLPTQLGFDHGGYGPNQCRFEPGTGELIVQQFTDLLASLKS